MTGLLIGPANYAGQASAWADAVQTHLAIDSVSLTRRSRLLSLAGRGGFKFSTTRVLPDPRLQLPLSQNLRAVVATRGITHFAIDGFLPIRPRANGLASDIEWLGRRGIQIALIAHGSDVRHPDLHMEMNGFSYFRDAPFQWVESRRKTARENRDIALGCGLPLFVSTPDLLADLPSASWLPVTTNLAKWSSLPPPQFSYRPRVLHLPSRRIPPIKGTEYIEPVLQRLHDERLIRWISVERVAPKYLPLLIGKVDIVVDQILTGSYGVAAVEAMAAGRVVVGGIRADLIRERVFPDTPPIVNVDPVNFEVEFRRLLRHPAWCHELASSGPGYVHRYHDGRQAATAMSPFLGHNQN